MKAHWISRFLRLVLAVKLFVIIFHAPSGSSDPQKLYKSCSNTFNCGSTINGIGYPFRDIQDPPYCGHPSFILSCDPQSNVTRINLIDTMYQVLEINQTAQIMRVVRDDIVVETCPQQMVNTTLDYTFFDYASMYTNYTFLYGCPASKYPGLKPLSCWSGGLIDGDLINVYLLPGNLGPGKCNASVVIPGPGNGDVGNGNSTGLVDVLRVGFEIKWELDSKACLACTESNGRCGFNFENNQTDCICSGPPYLGDTCKIFANESAPIPESSPPPFPGNSSLKKMGLIIGLALTGSLLTGVGSGFLIFCCKKRRKKQIATKNVDKMSKHIAALSLSKGPSFPRSMNFSKSIPSYPSSKSELGRGSTYFGAHVFAYSELEEATNNFDPSRELGDGGFGTVYYGVLADGLAVAVKRLYESNVRRVEQFMNEVEILTRLRHENLVVLYGCTSRRSRELILVYEYIQNGTVADHLHGKRAKSGLLSWPLRLNIAIETAEALTYLHKADIIHRDVKTNNVLLDHDFHVKVADFGLSRLFPTDVTHVSTAPQGTPGYVDPEYYQCYQLTEKSDVYSFGVMLVELISSLQAVDTNRHRQDINLSNMAINKIQDRTLHELVDPNLGFDTNSTVRRMVTLVAELAFRCLQHESDVRPSMEDVLEVLRGIQKGDLNVNEAEVVDILVDEDARLLNVIVDPLSPESVVANKWGSSSSTPNSSG
ncbi:LOW QUALITY PROTEIN: LEAF RUST 10 DISEASE-RESISTANCEUS RECEPTOR-LIKE PROTEIN KINASE-like 1.4 [Primulina eburnea]|uniref:LOW QUALITY PROTEIN: LEAF RUST 10 DISEASE-RESISTANCEUS RECEPTOR-LIKE PROTEIN KINASE-like 1.4 n=1 Tax=Primulina eburnea TaxID=1245227 RepID=UPI003C6CAAF5